MKVGFISEDSHDLGLSQLVDYEKDGLPDDIKYDKICLYLTKIFKDLKSANDTVMTENQKLRIVM